MVVNAPKPPSPPPPAPPPKPIPVETDPSVRQAAIESERSGRKRKGRDSTLLSGGALGDDQAGVTPTTATKTLLGG